ncbi:MAG: hypothetical protein ACRDI2_15695 [Chloroflexota bacterium]
MGEGSGEVVTVEEIEHRYPDEWVLMEVTRDHRDHLKVRGRLLAHGADREVLQEPYFRFRAENPQVHTYQFFTGDVVAEGFVAVL